MIDVAVRRAIAIWFGGDHESVRRLSSRGINGLRKAQSFVALCRREFAKIDGDGKNPAAIALGRKGGVARAMSLSNARRKEIAKRAAAARWGKEPD